MDVQKKIDEIVEAVGNARSMPMSASCVVNRAELLAMLEEVRQALPGSLAHAQELIGGREQLVEQARQEAERIITSAHAERGSLISDTQVARQSQDEADRILSEARRDAEEIRAEADDYVDSKLANFEVVLNKTIGSVDRGREKLLGRGPGLDEQGYADDDAPEYTADPQTLIQRADEYVDAKLGAFEAVLSKTLDAVGRGRQKLHGRTTSDALGEHMAAQDAAGAQQHASDADYLAGLAELADPQVQAQHQHQPQAAEQQPRIPAQAPPVQMPAQVPAQPDPYAYQPQEAYAGYQQQDPYAAYQQQGYDQQQYAQQDPYAYQQQPQHQPQQPQHQPQGAALDETSLFDTSMIDLEQLRRYEQGR
ncbi:cell division initiation protein [Streptomyces sp. NBC_01142]|uniref:cell division initiation protein n=1 Tax=Streptomyces sp. NBC_01142 TaxID=2975865 RepID=UPI0022571FC7|nr:cell division initiation protein [Streptomyces sp. NBC_01142]MCX4819631.1 cell division initiation protein [Streptomyces sp. NBC_01142]